MMKSTFIALAYSVNARVQREESIMINGYPLKSQAEIETDFRLKRYSNTADMWFKLGNTKRNWLNLHGYGCYCLNLGDRPLSSSTHGVDARDEIDQLCESWSTCNKCAGVDINGCTPETKAYTFTVSSNDVTCGGSNCGKSLCECDKQFIESVQPIIDTKWNAGNSVFNWEAPLDWDEHCSPPPPSSSTGVSPKCCGYPGLRVPYSPATHTCCASDQTVEETGIC